MAKFYVLKYYLKIIVIDIYMSILTFFYIKYFLGELRPKTINLILIESMLVVLFK